MDTQIEKNKKELPVDITFVGIVLRDSLSAALMDALRKLDAPQEVIDLVDSLDAIAYYLYLANYDSSVLTTKDKKRRFYSEEMLVEGINRLAVVGADFYAPMGTISGREGAFLSDKTK